MTCEKTGDVLESSRGSAVDGGNRVGGGRQRDVGDGCPPAPSVAWPSVTVRP